MIAHFEDGTSRKMSTGSATMGMRVVRWEFDAHDMRDLLANPELLPILATRMPPTPPKREWVGLTDEEVEQIVDECWDDPQMFIEVTEAKLKEKNK